MAHMLSSKARISLIRFFNRKDADYWLEILKVSRLLRAYSL